MSSTKPGDVNKIAQTAEAIAENHINDPAAASAVENSSPEIVTLSTGVRLEIYTGMSLGGLADIDGRFPDPPVPIIEIDGRNVENPSSPTYITAKNANDRAKGLAVVDMIVLLCTRLASFPDDLDGPDSPEWEEKLELMGYVVKGRLGRYLHWVKLVAAPGDVDWGRLTAAAARRLGVLEEDVQRALGTFPDNS